MDCNRRIKDLILIFSKQVGNKNYSNDNSSGEVLSTF